MAGHKNASWKLKKWGHFSCSLRLYYSSSSSDSPSVAHKLKCVIKLFLSHMLSCRSCFDTVAASWVQTQNEEDSSTIHIRHARRKIAFVSRTRITAAICVLFTAAQLVSTSFTPSLIQHVKERKKTWRFNFELLSVALTFKLDLADFCTCYLALVALISALPLLTFKLHSILRSFVALHSILHSFLHSFAVIVIHFAFICAHFCTSITHLSILHSICCIALHFALKCCICTPICTHLLNWCLNFTFCCTCTQITNYSTALHIALIWSIVVSRNTL